MPEQELKPDEVAPQLVDEIGLHDEPKVKGVAAKEPEHPSFVGCEHPVVCVTQILKVVVVGATEP